MVTAMNGRGASAKDRWYLLHSQEHTDGKVIHILAERERDTERYRDRQRQRQAETEADRRRETERQTGRVR